MNISPATSEHEPTSISTVNTLNPRLSILNPKPRLKDGPQLLHKLVQHKHGDPLALDFIDPGGLERRLSYDSLEKESSALASRLARLFNDNPSIATEKVIIPVLIPQCIELYISLLAILKIGAAFCPLGLDAPGERIRFVIGDVSAKVLLTTKGYKDQVPSIPGLSVFVVDDDLNSDASETVSVIRHVTPQDLAYVMYSE